MFIDKAEIFVKAGNGGRGANSFTRSKRNKYQKANGGDGGQGGDVIIQRDGNLSTLLNFQYKRHFYASSGGDGSSNNKKGKDAEDCIIKVPPGTIVRKLPEGFILRDLDKSSDSVIAAKGGRSGRGNHRKKIATYGQKGEELSLSLELKIIADVGLIGYPNSGKSTLISRISNAKPKIADYPFTTKFPVLGLTRMNDKEFVVVEVPAFGKGACKGAGLGIEFLKHIERTKLLVYILDTTSIFVSDLCEQLNYLFEEVKSFDLNIFKKPYIVCLNKIDLLSSKNEINICENKIKNKIYSISALRGDGIQKLLRGITKRIF